MLEESFVQVDHLRPGNQGNTEFGPFYLKEFTQKNGSNPSEMARINGSRALAILDREVQAHSGLFLPRCSS